MRELQALITGAITGALMNAEQVGFLIDVQPQTDENGYLPEIIVIGRESREVVRIRIEGVE